MKTLHVIRAVQGLLIMVAAAIGGLMAILSHNRSLSDANFVNGLTFISICAIGWALLLNVAIRITSHTYYPVLMAAEKAYLSFEDDDKLTRSEYEAYKRLGSARSDLRRQIVLGKPSDDACASVKRRIVTACSQLGIKILK